MALVKGYHHGYVPSSLGQGMKAQIDVIKVSPEPLVRHGLVKMLTTGSAIPHRVAAALVLDQFGKVELRSESIDLHGDLHA